MVMSVNFCHDPDYLTSQVGAGREDYYLDAQTSGEPPGVWWGAGAAHLGLSGEVDAQDMKDLYTHFRDPRDERWADPAQRAACRRFGKAPSKFRNADEIFEELRDRAQERLAPGEQLRPEQLAELQARARRQVRQAVHFIDCTYSPVKSVTVLHTAYARQEVEARRAGDAQAAQEWAAKRVAVEDAVWVGNEAMLTYLTEHAGYTQAGRHTKGVRGWWEDAPDWTVASFFQHTSRDLDPQLHVHNAVLNRVVRRDDGQVRTVDGTSVTRCKQAAGTVGDVTMMQHLSRSLGVSWRPRADGNGWEIVGVDTAAMDLFSKRSKVVSPRVRRWSEEFTRGHGRPPTALELSEARQRLVLATRRAKTHEGELRSQQLDRWEDELRTRVAGGLARVAGRVGSLSGEVASDRVGSSGRVAESGSVGSATRVAGSGQVGSGRQVAGSGRVGSAGTFSPSGVINEAVARCQQARTSWGRSELTRQLLAAVVNDPGVSLVDVPAVELAERLADAVDADRRRVVLVAGRQPTRTVPSELRRADGRSRYEEPTGRRYATRGEIAVEAALRRAARVTGGEWVLDGEVGGWLASDPVGRRLSADQAAAVRGLLSTPALVSVLVGPAGTGKSFTLGVTAKAWRELTGGRVIGLAPSQIATQVLGADIAEAINTERERRLVDEGLQAMNVSRWLATQQRLSGAGVPSRKDASWVISKDDIIVVDEASMVTNDDLEAIRRRVESAGARMVLTGDPRQLAAVGAGGAMEMLADGVAVTYTLSEVRRFEREWERETSLLLRDGDPQAAVEYARRGQLLDCGTVEQAAQDAALSYVADRIEGHDSIIVTVTNDEAARTSMLVREQLVALGMVAESGVDLGLDGTVAGVGDVVQGRRNAWGIGAVNRERYRVEQVDEAGGMTVRALDGGRLVQLPAGYVREHLSLGYAATAHSAQGVTVDICHAIVQHGMSMEGLYVALTRGRIRNTGHVATHPEAAGEFTGETHGRERMPVDQVVASVLGRDRAETRAALVQLAEDVRAARSMATVTARFEDAVRFIGRVRTDRWLDDLAARGALSADERSRLASDDATEALSRLLRAVEQSGQDPQAVLAQAVGERSLDGSVSVAQVLHHRITGQVGQRPQLRGTALGDMLPAGVSPQWRDYLQELADLADTRRRELAEETAAQAPRWAVEAFGPVPQDPAGRLDWEHRAGTVAAYREAVGWDDEAQPVGPAPSAAEDGSPGPGLASTERRALWWSAWTALGRPEATSEEQGLSDGQLRVRVHAWRREQEWAPAWVDDDMSAAGQESVRHQREATLLAARSRVEQDPGERSRLESQAQRAQVMADQLRQVEEDLSVVSREWSSWYSETAATRVAAERAQEELARRGRDVGAEPDRVPVEEWMAAHDEAMRSEDPHRPVTEVDVTDHSRDAAGRGVDGGVAAPNPVDDSGAAVPAQRGDESQPATVAESGAAQGSDADRSDRDGTGAVQEPEMPRRLPSPARSAAAVAHAQAAADRIAERRDEERVQRLAQAEVQAEQAEQARREQRLRDDADRTARQQAADAQAQTSSVDTTN